MEIGGITTIKLPSNVTPNGFEFLRSYVYGEHPIITDSNFIDVLTMSQALKIESIFQDCIESFNNGSICQNMHSGGDFLRLIANLPNNIQQMEGLGGRMAGGNPSDLKISNIQLTPEFSQEIVTNPLFLDLNQNILIQLLDNDFFGIREEYLYERCVEWAEKRALINNNDQNNITKEWKDYINQIKYSIRFPLFSSDYFDLNIADSKILTEDESYMLMRYFSEKKNSGFANNNKNTQIENIAKLWPKYYPRRSNVVPKQQHVHSPNELQPIIGSINPKRRHKSSDSYDNKSNSSYSDNSGSSSWSSLGLGSKIDLTEKEFGSLQSFLGTKWGHEGCRWKLLFQGSKQFFDAKEFHASCYDQTPTVILIKTRDKMILGGFTERSWKIWPEDNVKSKADRNAFIFVLRKGENYNNKNIKSRNDIPAKFKRLPTGKSMEKGIYTMIEHGPIFGAKYDLFISNQCHLNEKSYLNLGGTYTSMYNISNFKGKTSFHVSEYEAWQIFAVKERKNSRSISRSISKSKSMRHMGHPGHVGQHSGQHSGHVGHLAHGGHVGHIRGSHSRANYSNDDKQKYLRKPFINCNDGLEIIKRKQQQLVDNHFQHSRTRSYLTRMNQINPNLCDVTFVVDKNENQQEFHCIKAYFALHCHTLVDILCNKHNGSDNVNNSNLNSNSNDRNNIHNHNQFNYGEIVDTNSFKNVKFANAIGIGVGDVSEASMILSPASVRTDHNHDHDVDDDQDDQEEEEKYPKKTSLKMDDIEIIMATSVNDDDDDENSAAPSMEQQKSRPESITVDASTQSRILHHHHHSAANSAQHTRTGINASVILDIDEKKEFVEVNEKGRIVVSLPNIRCDAFKFLRSYVYGLYPIIDKDNVSILLDLCFRLKLSSIETDCVNFVNFMIDKKSDVEGYLKVLVDLYNMNEKAYQQQNINNRWARYTQTFCIQVLTSQTFQTLPQEILRGFLRNSDFVAEESVIYENCVKWAKYHSKLAISMENAKIAKSNSLRSGSGSGNKSLSRNNIPSEPGGLAGGGRGGVAGERDFNGNDNLMTWIDYIQQIKFDIRFPLLSLGYFNRNIADSGVLTAAEGTLLMRYWEHGHNIHNVEKVKKVWSISRRGKNNRE